MAALDLVDTYAGWKGSLPEEEVCAPRRGCASDVELVLVRAQITDGILDAEMLYRVEAHDWRQPFVACLRDERQLGRMLEEAAVAWERWIDRNGGWLLAHRV